MTGRRARGLTLIELMMALVVSTIVIAAAVALMKAQQRVYRAGGDERQIQEAARVAIDEMTSNLAMAGYGIDPALAFDFGGLDTLVLARAPSGAAVSSKGFRCATGSEVTCRDRIDGSDEIVFRSRDPGFGRRLTKVPTSASLTVDGPLGAPLQAGQILQVACYTSPMTWAYVTVGDTVKVDPSATEVAIPLQAGDGDVFPLQNDWLTTGSCFSATAAPGADAPTIDAAAKVFKIDTYRYYIQAFDGRPYLMLDQGFAEPTVVAPDVEDLQFSYTFPRSPAGLQQAGDVVDTRLENSEAGIDLAAIPPTFYTLTDAVERTTHHPANIRAVRVTALVRAPTEAPDGNWGSLQAAGNRKIQAGANYRRFLLETTSQTRNLDSRAPYYPSWSAGVDGAGNPIDVLNKGGG